jgi:hypothetical protein
VIPAELERIILDCLEKDPARRPPTAAVLGDRLAACPLARQWTRERAEDWWRTYMPQPEPERQVADVLLSHEGSHASVLRPRRSTRPVGSAGSR